MLNIGAGPEDSTGTVPTPRLSEMFLRFVRADGQGRAARTVELFGYFDFALGTLILVAPMFVARLLPLPALSLQTENYVRLVGLLVSGLGMLYIVSGRLNSQGFVFASLLDRPLVPLVMLILWQRHLLPGPLALAFAVADFSGFLWTLSAWKAEARTGRVQETAAALLAARLFGFTSGVLRNSRTFHPDGRVFTGTVRSLHPLDPSLARAADRLAGSAVLMRIGMGLMKTGMHNWMAKRIPDAPSIAGRFFAPLMPGEIRIERHAEEDLDLLCTAGGDRLWKLLLKLATGGRSYGLWPFDYFQNVYYTDTRYLLGDTGPDVWIRFLPQSNATDADVPLKDPAAREAALTQAVAQHRTIRIEAQLADDAAASFIPLAEIRLESEIEIDQEALHFTPVAGRGFEPHGFLTELRRSAYPASVAQRASTALEREQRENETLGTRMARYLGPSGRYVERGTSAGKLDFAQADIVPRKHPGLKTSAFISVGCVVFAFLYLAIRLTRDRPVEYTDDVMHFKYGSTGGERTMGIPYWFWVALPELFPEYLPDGKTGRGYKSFGMIYENGKDPRYSLPVGVSMRNVRGIDVVYLNCAVCHTGTVRDRPGAEPRVLTGMPAQALNLGSFEKFLTSIPLDQKFIPQRMLDQIDAMGDKERAREIARAAGVPVLPGSRRFAPGETSTISDHKDNVHWFLNESKDVGFIFNVHVIGYNPDNPKTGGRVYIDPNGEKLSGGLVKAPKITYGKANQMYG